MNSQYEKQLEESIRRELNALGELSAPPALANRVLRLLEQRVAKPWYRQAWQTWPRPLQGVSIAGLMALFGGICFGVVLLSQAAEASPVGQRAGEWFAWFEVLWRTASVLVNAIVVAFHQLGMGIVMGGIMALIAAYAACVGLGAACVRLAMEPIKR
ncbi:MAG: hypothetical protein ABIP71_06480 [Verrucomicrobiota bacterium]